MKKKLQYGKIKVLSARYKEYCKNNNMDSLSFINIIKWNDKLNLKFNELELYRIFAYSKKMKTLIEYF
jgi:hypothetical protein